MSLSASAKSLRPAMIKVLKRQFSNTNVKEKKVGSAQIYKAYHKPSGLKGFMASALAGLVFGLPVISFHFLLPTAWIGPNTPNFAFVDNPKAPLTNPSYTTARYNEDGVPVSPGGSA